MPQDPVMWKAALVAWVLAVPLWFLTRFFVVIAHEGGHAFAGVALLNQVRRITFNRDGGGGTEFVSPPPWPFVIVVAVAGYAGPSLFGLLAAALLLRGEPRMVLWGSMAFLVLMLFTVRGIIGWIVVPVLVVGLYQLATKAPAEMSTLGAYVWTWFLLIGAVQRMLVYLTDKTYLVEAADTTRLQQVSLVPSEIWSVLLLLGTGAALVWGGSMLLRMPS
ncbi:M50 family metallopeptidase [Actinoplanes sp. NPDC049265]|uniref:M50 family metallopeptidase n=1 Tax=Actinoplanes sp. NPDC049265 TaxID=3363902 RepID=UPI0037105570